MTQLSFPSGLTIDFGDRSREEILEKINTYKKTNPDLFINQNAQQEEQQYLR